MTLEARAQVLSVQARALQLAEPSADDQAESRRLMRERGLSPQAARIIAAVVPLAYVRANLATVPAGRGANPAGVVAAALWRDDADWFAAEKRRRARAITADNADAARRETRAEWHRINDDAAAASAAERAKLAHLTDADVFALLCAARDRMPAGPERDEIQRLIHARRRDRLGSPTLRQLAIQELETHGLPHRVATGDVVSPFPYAGKLRTVRKVAL